MTTENQSAETDRLLWLAQSGDKNALDALFAGHRNYLRRVVELRMVDELRCRMDPSDVIQETQLAAARQIPRYLADRRVSFRIWLRQTAIQQLVNLVRHHVQARKRSLKREVRLPDRSSMLLAESLMKGRPSRIMRKQELAQQVRDVLQSMSENDREILLLRHYEELSNGEIGELLDIDTDTVSKRYGRAIRRLREKMKEEGISEDN